MVTYEKLMRDLQERKFLPIYYLMGEEPYYIDKVSDYIEHNVLDEDDQGFNQTIVFGADTTMVDVINMAKRYPMMSERQVIIVKEAQSLKNTEALEKYLINPMLSTILVFCHKGGSLDKRKKLANMLMRDDNVAVFESKKLKEQDLPLFISTYLKVDNITIDEKSSSIIASAIGSDLNRLTSELEKLKIGLEGDVKCVTPELVEEKIGVSKDFNAFELRDAVISKNVFKANQIAEYFDKNPKAGSVYSVLPLLFQYFATLMQAHYSPKKDERSLSEWLGVSIWATRAYTQGLRNYSARKTLNIIHKLREIDAKSKGLDNPNISAGELMKELLFFIMH